MNEAMWALGRAGGAVSLVLLTVSVLHIDWTHCDGRRLCTEHLADVLEPDEWGYPRSLGYGSDVPIPARSLSAARESVSLCPRVALGLRPN